MYADAAVVLLDDIFAALDASVGRNVFERCVLGLCAGKTRVLVTHNTDIITHPAVDQLLTVENGVVSNPHPKALDAAQEERKEHVVGAESKISSILTATIPSSAWAVDGGKGTVASGSQGLESQEERARGRVDAKVYLFYLNALGGVAPLVFLCLVQLRYSLTSWLTYLLTHSPTHSLTYLLTHLLTH